jgi:hypothetical protein
MPNGLVPLESPRPAQLLSPACGKVGLKRAGTWPAELARGARRSLGHAGPGLHAAVDQRSNGSHGFRRPRSTDSGAAAYA